MPISLEQELQNIEENVEKVYAAGQNSVDLSGKMDNWEMDETTDTATLTAPGSTIHIENKNKLSYLELNNANLTFHSGAFGNFKFGDGGIYWGDNCKIANEENPIFNNANITTIKGTSAGVYAPVMLGETMPDNINPVFSNKSYVNKEYLNSRIADLETRIEALENA